jgi:hypothetical protein
MRRSYHADESTLQVHLCQVRELDLCTVEATATCTVKTPWNTHPTAVSPLNSEIRSASILMLGTFSGILTSTGCR